MARRQTILSILIFFIAFSLLYFIFWDSIASAFRAFLSFRQAAREVENARSLIEEVPALSQRFQEMSSQSLPLFQALPTQFSESDVLVSISTLASESGLILNKIQIQEPDAQGKVMVEATLAGNVTSLERFFAGLESSSPIFDLVSTGFDGSAGLQSFTVRMHTYVLPQAPKEERSFGTLRKEIDAVLETNLDILKDPELAKLKESSQVPVPLPSSDLVGRSNPFAPL